MLSFLSPMIFGMIEPSKNKGGSLMYQIKYVYGHYNVYAPSGRFLFSADTESEAWEEIDLLEA